MKILILGHGRHGKDTLAELLRDLYGIEFRSSSQLASEIFIYKKLKSKYDYKTHEECFNDRHNCRKEWHDLICEYNEIDKARLAKEILKVADCYVGMRDVQEFDEAYDQALFDLVIWVDASERLPFESNESFNIDKRCADIIIENNYTKREFIDKSRNLFDLILKKR